MMSLINKHGSKVNMDYKARLEYKLYLARENPEPVFDISECALKHVPPGIYSLCKVFRKKILWMYCNKLSSLSGGGNLNDLSLLTILDLHGNQFNTLPPDIMCLVSLKEQRQFALLELERNIKQQKEYEIEVQSMLKSHKKKLLKDLALQQTQLEHKLEKVQKERDTNRARLLSYISNAEKEADNVIKEFLRNSEEERQTQAELLEREAQEEMQLLSSCHSEQFLFRTKDTLLAMEELLEEELYRTRKFEEHTNYKNYTAQSLLSLEVRQNDHLAQIVQNQEKSRQDLIDKIRQDEVLQKVAVAALLERSDARSWSIMQQVNLVQSQLAALTNIELERRKFEINQQLNEIAERRVALSAILISLLEQQKNRRDQLLETINHIEQKRSSSDLRRSSQFWLMQYHSLMETRPQGLLEMLEPTLVRHVAIAGALHCLPFLATLPSLLPNINDEQLQAIGITNERDRAAIKMAAENYLAEIKTNEDNSSILPSAPPEEASTSYNQPELDIGKSINTAECVVCLDLQCEVIFLPCGHLCCCSNCANMVSSKCPMCRSIIERKMRILKP
ncbi:E3 ubiquitin-protein ligase LRSAM1-like isoform X7 [Vespa velutina]|uniref:E3 ubiquitin-protein ligase LRSAM1-like isoform X7 n=1 Tax=Vespa velutina TaxID=202808 RepID=UPI001FB2BC12|nr:E3 ubiquitin-protein ligase LRSAM1-like isoform X7 [Vespa velutina]